MSEIWLGLSNKGNDVILVTLKFEDDTIEILSDTTWSLQKGDRPEAYCIMHARVLCEMKERSIKNAVIRASVVPARGSVSAALLHAAELRGVLMAAAAESGAKIFVKSKASVSKGTGGRNTDDYVSDDAFWTAKIAGAVRKGSRETAFFILEAQKR